MASGIYSFLESIGFYHPLHPVLTHVPMGMVIGAFLFGLLALKWTDKHFAVSAFYCSAVALIAIFPTAFFGIIDWQYHLQGEWYPLIIVKMSLTVILIILLSIAIVMRNRGATSARLFWLYLLCLVCAGGIGYSGGDLVYG